MESACYVPFGAMCNVLFVGLGALVLLVARQDDYTDVKEEAQALTSLPWSRVARRLSKTLEHKHPQNKEFRVQACHLPSVDAPSRWHNL